MYCPCRSTCDRISFALGTDLSALVQMSRIEKVELTVLCLIHKDNQYLLQDRVKNDWRGYILRGRRYALG